MLSACYAPFWFQNCRFPGQRPHPGEFSHSLTLQPLRAGLAPLRQLADLTRMGSEARGTRAAAAVELNR